MVKPIAALGVDAESFARPHPTFPDFLNDDVGKFEWRRLGDAFHLSQFGVKLETVFPGMLPNMCVGFKAGVENGHHLINRSRSPASFLVVGTRVSGDETLYPDNDLRWVEVDGQYRAARKDGTFY